MDVIEVNGETAAICMKASELAILANALNEVREGLEEWEFSTRVGAPAAEAETLRQSLVALLDRLK